MKISKLLLAVCGAIVLLGAFIASASGRQLQVSSSTYRAQYTAWRLQGLPGTGVCQLTLEGNFHSRTITKTLRSLIGYITSAAIGICSVGRIIVLARTPFHRQYAGFAGTLPNITRLLFYLIGLTFSYQETGGITCLMTSTVTEPIIETWTVEAGVATGSTLGGSIRSGGECFGTTITSTSDAGVLFVLGTTTRITIRLI